MLISSTKIISDAETPPKEYVEIDTTYTSFIIKHSDGRFAEYKDLKRTGGDLRVYSADLAFDEGWTTENTESGEVKVSNNKWTFIIPSIEGDEYYTITQTKDTDSRGNKIDEFYTMVGVSSDFSTVLKNNEIGKLKIHASGRLETEFDKPTTHSFSQGNDLFTTPWNYYEISGESTGFTFIPYPNRVVIYSKIPTEIDINFGRIARTMTSFDKKIPIDSKGIAIYGINGRAIIVDRDKSILSHKRMRCTVLFWATDISTQVSYKSKVKRPKDPKSDRIGEEVFGGWYKDAGRTIPWDFDNDIITEDWQRIYVKWISN
ncbi:MAG: InlB B-repeat-containing protein [Oscillospiraceae bacterium]|nr:InlB B-repeat-containing protein [Oscillospiraceae bacterium]